MEQENGTTVKVDYTGKLDDGTVFDTTEGKKPLEFEIGKGQILPTFEQTISKMKVGEKTSFKISAKDGYGEKNPQLVREIPSEGVPEDVEAGSNLIAQTPQGQIPLTVVEVKEKTLLVDMNHPLAGQNLNFEVTLVESNKPQA